MVAVYIIIDCVNGEGSAGTGPREWRSRLAHCLTAQASEQARPGAALYRALIISFLGADAEAEARAIEGGRCALPRCSS